MRFFSNKFASEMLDGTRNFGAAGLKWVLLNGRRTGVTAAGGSGQITLASTTGLKIGMNVEERDSIEVVITTHIPTNAKILTVDDATHVTLDKTVSAIGGSGMTVYFHPDRDFDTFDQAAGIEVGTSPNPAHTGYTPGFAGAGRKTVGSKTYTESDSLDAGIFDAADPSWNATFGNGWVTGIALVVEVTNDAASRFVGYNSDGGWPFFANGNTFTVTLDPNGVCNLLT